MDDGQRTPVHSFAKDVPDHGSASHADLTVLSRLEVQNGLLNVFLHHVNSIFKILHRPSLCAFLLEGKPYLNYTRGHLAPVALGSAVFYVASVTMTDEQSIEVCGEKKEVVVARYKNETKSALNAPGFSGDNRADNGPSLRAVAGKFGTKS